MIGSENKGFKLGLRIDWSELDLFGHVNNVMYFKYLQAARVNAWDLIGLSKSFEESKLGAMLLSTNCNFKKPLYYPGNIDLVTHVSFIKNTSFGFEHSVFNQANELVATGSDVIVFYNYHKNVKQEIPGWLRTQLEKNLAGE